MKKLSGYPAWFYWTLLGGGALVTLTGLLMLPTMLEFKLEWDVPWRLASESRLWSVSVHLLAGWVLIFMLGALWQAHMRAGWRKRKNHITGILTGIQLVLLALTGTGLYYFSSLEAQLYSGVIHSLFGALFALLFAYHGVKGAKIRRKTR